MHFEAAGHRFGVFGGFLNGFFTKMEERWKGLRTTDPSCPSQRLQCNNQRQSWRNVHATGHERSYSKQLGLRGKEIGTDARIHSAGNIVEHDQGLNRENTPGPSAKSTSEHHTATVSSYYKW